MKLLVDLRADLLRVRRRTTTSSRQVDESSTQHLATLFDVGLLSLRRITWDAPASLLEKLIAYEAVHAIDSWADLKNRLDSDRRCYAFFHPAMPTEPLVFVEIALTTGIATRAADAARRARARPRPRTTPTPRCSIRSRTASPASPGVNLGNALDQGGRRAAAPSTFRTLQRFVTLSPIPGFRRWLDDRAPHRRRSRTRERELLPAEPDRVLARLADDDWDADEAIKPALLALCARYLDDRRATGASLDPGRQLPLANGASLERINWLADPSPTGRDRSAGSWRTTSTSPTRIATRAERVRTATRRGRDVDCRRELPRKCSGRIGSGPWRSSSTSSGIGRRAIRTTSASSSRRHRAAAARCGRARVCRCDLDDDDAQVPTMVPVPDDELPVRACVSIWVDAHDTRGAVRGDARRAGIRRAGYLVTESLYRDYGDNEHAPARDWPDGERSPGIMTLTIFDKPHGHGRRDVLRPLVRPPVADVGVDAAAVPLRAQRGRARRSRRARRATRRSSRRRGRRSSTAHRSADVLRRRRRSDELGERIRIMLDSTKLLYDPDTMRNYTLSASTSSRRPRPNSAAS